MPLVVHCAVHAVPLGGADPVSSWCSPWTLIDLAALQPNSTVLWETLPCLSNQARNQIYTRGQLVLPCGGHGPTPLALQTERSIISGCLQEYLTFTQPARAPEGRRYLRLDGTLGGEVHSLFAFYVDTCVYHLPLHSLGCQEASIGVLGATDTLAAN
jgi:hypothetical protein